MAFLQTFPGKHLCWSVFFKRNIRKTLQHRYFPVKIAKFLRTFFFYGNLPVVASWSQIYRSSHPKVFLRKQRCSENAQQIYRRTPMPRCDFNKVAKQSHFGMCVLLYISWLLSEHLFLRTLLDGWFWICDYYLLDGAHLVAVRGNFQPECVNEKSSTERHS